MALFTKNKKSKKEVEGPFKDGKSPEKKVQSINLIPPPTEEEVEYVERKGKRSVSGVLFIALVIFVTVSVLGFNLWVKLRLNQGQQRLAETENEIERHKLEEIQKKTLDNKLSAYQAVVDQDFNADRVLEYLLEVTEGLSNVRTLYLDNDMKFEIRGTATTYTNVARLWHDMSREEGYFESISLERVSRTDTGDVNFVFSGFMVKEQVVTL